MNIRDCKIWEKNGRYEKTTEKINQLLHDVTWSLREYSENVCIYQLLNGY